MSGAFAGSCVIVISMLVNNSKMHPAVSFNRVSIYSVVFKFRHLNKLFHLTIPRELLYVLLMHFPDICKYFPNPCHYWKRVSLIKLACFRLQIGLLGKSLHDYQHPQYTPVKYVICSNFYGKLVEFLWEIGLLGKGLDHCYQHPQYIPAENDTCSNFL